MSLLQLAATGGSLKLYVDDVFSTYTRTGTGASQTITTGINLSTRGGVVHSKSRSAVTDHSLHATVLGTTYDLVTNSTAAMANEAQSLTAVSTTGHTWGTLAKINTNLATYVDWVFADAPKFHKTAVVVKSAGSNATVDLYTLGTVGMVRVKRTDAAGSWYIWHRSLTAGNLLIGETTAAEATLGHITVSGTTVTLVNGVIADGTYLVEGFAHDTTTDGIIQCGSFTSDALSFATVTLGWEPQFVLMKSVSSTSNWVMLDTMREWIGTNTVAYDKPLSPNLSAAEATGDYGHVNATGFEVNNMNDSATGIYLAIRRPNKPPTSGTQVYNAIARTGTGAAATVAGVGFAPDLVMPSARNNGGMGYASFWDRLRGSTNVIIPYQTSAEAAKTDAVLSLEMDGMKVGVDSTNSWVNATTTYINHFFRRAPGVHDQICYAGTGANKTEAHTLLGVPPELWVDKGRSGATQWVWGSSLLAATEKIVMPSPAGAVTDATAWNSTYPTASLISLGTAAEVNTSSATYSLWMWATLAGISKVFGYTGDGTSDSSKIVDCGFAAGARFVMIIRATASTAQDIFIWDSVRGIIAGNDPHLSLNTTAAEVTTDDSIDPDASGFIVNQLAATNINVNGATYIGLAYA